MNIPELLAKVAEITQRAEKATPGPWQTYTEYRHSSTEVCTALIDANGDRLSDTLNADGQTVNQEVDEDGASYYITGPCVDALEFAAAARSDIPYLCDAVRELAKRVQELEAKPAPAYSEYERPKSWNDDNGFGGHR